MKYNLIYILCFSFLCVFLLYLFSSRNDINIVEYNIDEANLSNNVVVSEESMLSVPIDKIEDKNEPLVEMPKDINPKVLLALDDFNQSLSYITREDLIKDKEKIELARNENVQRVIEQEDTIVEKISLDNNSSFKVSKHTYLDGEIRYQIENKYDPSNPDEGWIGNFK